MEIAKKPRKEPGFASGPFPEGTPFSEQDSALTGIEDIENPDFFARIGVHIDEIGFPFIIRIKD